MNDVRRVIARIVEGHLEMILDRVIAAYKAEIPAVRAAPDAVTARVRQSTRRATQAFLALYADPETPARQMLNDARNATIDRAGELFDREDIIAMIRVGRHIIFQSAREFVRAEVAVDAEHETEMAGALEDFMRELERTEELLPQTDDAIHVLLASAENEGPDIA